MRSLQHTPWTELVHKAKLMELTSSLPAADVVDEVAADVTGLGEGGREGGFITWRGGLFTADSNAEEEWGVAVAAEDANWILFLLGTYGSRNRVARGHSSTMYKLIIPPFLFRLDIFLLGGNDFLCNEICS